MPYIQLVGVYKKTNHDDTPKLQQKRAKVHASEYSQTPNKKAQLK